MRSAIVSPLVNSQESIVQIASESALQVSRCLVQTSDGEQSEQVVIWSREVVHGEVTEKAVAALSTKGSDQISAVIEEVEGFARVRSADGRPQNAFHVAASVAVMKVSWGWDEEKPIVVRVNEDEFEIYASFDGSEWIAKDHP